MRRGRLLATGRLGEACTGALTAVAVCLGSAVASDLPPSVQLVIDDIFSPAGRSTAADVLKAILAIAEATPSTSATASPTSTPTPTASHSPTGTVTRTPTQRACPTGTASLEIEVDNQTGAPAARVRLIGIRAEGDCSGGAGLTAYELTVECSGMGVSTCASIPGLRPGSWVHSVEVLTPATGQVQHRPALMVATATADRLHYLLFPRVGTVDTTADQGAGSLRNLLQNSASGMKPMLIQFDPAVFPPGVPTAVVWLSAPPVLSGSDVTIDGIDSTGASGNRILDANARTTAALTITGGRNHIIGLRLTNAGGNNRDVLSISGPGAVAILIESCIVDTAATADAIGIDAGAGGDFADEVTVVRDSEVFGATDKGIKVTTAAQARIENTWVHDNVNGGIQVTFGARASAFENLVEDNRGGTAQNGISVLGSTDDDGTGKIQFSEIDAQGNISRRNGANGFAVRAGADAVVVDNYLAANDSNGIRVSNDVGPPASADVQGTTAACNGTDGAVVADESTADFGLGPRQSPGNNAFTQNNLPAGFENFANTTGAVVFAANAQWEHCGRETTCNLAEIERLDINSGGMVEIAPAQAHRALQPEITTISPRRGKRGELLRIYGSGFNVIDGHFGEDRCADVEARNTCLPIRGNCVQIAGARAAVEAVTPTMLIVRWPFTCVEPVSLVVKVDQGMTVATSNTVSVCE